MKKIIAILTASIMGLSALSLSACSDVEIQSEVASTSEQIGLEEVSRDRWCIYAYDRDTKVLYIISRGTDGRGAACVMVDQDGKPRIYEEENEEKNKWVY